MKAHQPTVDNTTEPPKYNIMKASEAKKLSEEKAIPMSEIYKMIKNTAESGKRSQTFFCYLSQEKIGQLITDGYKVSGFVDPIGMEGFKVEW